jgi:hypothetical protein
VTAYLLRRLGTSIIVLIGISIAAARDLPVASQGRSGPAGQQRADRRVEQGQRL